MKENMNENRNLYFTKDGIPTFYLWFTCKYLGQPNIYGDIAFDNHWDKSWPLDNKYSSIRRHLHPSDERMMEVLDETWPEYKRFVNTERKIKVELRRGGW